MNAQITVRLVSLLALTFVLALNSSASAQATTTTTSTTTPLGGTIGSSCQGEVIDISGQVHATFHNTVTPNGDSNLVIHLNVHGSGVGQTTGLTYEFNQSSNSSFNRHGSGALEFNSEDFIRVFATGNQPNDDFFFRAQTHVIFNANGEVTAQVSHFERVCD